MHLSPDTIDTVAILATMMGIWKGGEVVYKRRKNNNGKNHNSLTQVEHDALMKVASQSTRQTKLLDDALVELRAMNIKLDGK